VVKKSWHDFDLNKNGCVTRDQFLRGLPDKFQSALTDADIQVLVDKYSVPDAYGTGIDISYQCLHKDISASDPALCLPDGRPVDRPQVYDPKDRIPVLTPLERKVQQICRDRRFEMRPFFEDFDKLHSGFVPVKVFARTMCTLGLNHLKEELEELASLYQSDRHQDRWVDYRAFIREMQDPRNSVRSVLQEVFLRLRKEFSARGATGLVGLVRSFRAHDKSMENLVSVTAFPQALRACGVVLGSEEIDAINAQFSVGGRLNYLFWVCEVRGSLNRLRRQLVVKAFASALNEVGDVDMDALMARLEPRYHPMVLNGSMSVDRVHEEVAAGVSLGRDVAPSTQDLCDYWSFVTWELNDAQFAYCISRVYH